MVNCEAIGSNDIVAVDGRIYEMARLAAARVSPETLPAFRAAVLQRLSAYGEHPLIREWIRLADDGPGAVRRALLDASDHGRALRTFAPYRALITREERAEIMSRLESVLARGV